LTYNNNSHNNNSSSSNNEEEEEEEDDDDDDDDDNNNNNNPTYESQGAKMAQSITNLTRYCVYLNRGHEYFFLIHRLKNRDPLMGLFCFLILVTAFHKLSGEHTSTVN
jgi:cobalamin biosynthesis protein CobT